MKNTSIVLSTLALLGVLVLFILHFSGPAKPGKSASTTSVNTVAGPFRIAYVDIDTFEANYTFLKNKREEFNKRQQAMQSELERSARQLQTNVEAFQRKAQSGNISQSEGEATEKQLVQMQQSLRLREQSLTEQLLKEKDEFNSSLHDQLDKFLTEYNKDRQYDYILSYSRSGSPILFANKELDITKDVIKGMNEGAGNQKDTVRKK
jgi:outer membrane protein